MRRSLYFVAVAAIALMLHSCTTMYNSSSYGYGDLYTTNNRAEVANQLKAKAEIERAEAEARQAQWQAMQAEAAADRAEAEYYASLNSEPSFSSVLATDYESAYARRLYGFQSPTYRLPASYYDLMTSSAYFYATAYDPAFYNVMVSGNQVWVEPKYVTSMFGTWGATNITFGIYASPWNFGWRYAVDPFYYSWWGYPRYSWYDWNWNLCYNPFHYDWYYWGYDPYHHHHHHHHPHHGPGHGPGPRPPQHRPEHGYTPGHVTGPGASGGHPGHNLNGNRPNSGTRYTSPTTNRSYGSSGHSGGRPAYSGTISTGIYTGKDSKNSTNTTYRGGSTNLNVTTRNNSNQSLNISSGGSSNRGNNNASTTTTKRGDNYRQSNSTTSRSSGTNSSNNSYNSSSNYRSGNSTSSSRSSSSNYNRYDTDRGYNSTSNYRSNNNSSTSRSTGGYGSGSTSRSSSGGARSGGSTSSRR